MNLVKDDFASMIEHGALIGGIGMLCFVSWYLSDAQKKYEAKKSNPQPAYQINSSKKNNSKLMQKQLGVSRENY